MGVFYLALDAYPDFNPEIWGMINRFILRIMVPFFNTG